MYSAPFQMLHELSETHRVEHVLFRNTAFAGDGNTPTHEAEFADRMGVRVDAQEATQLKRAPVPPPIQFQSVGVAVDLDGHAIAGAGFEDRLHLHLITGPTQQKSAGDVAEDGRLGVGDRSHDARCLFYLLDTEAAVVDRISPIKRMKD